MGKDGLRSATGVPRRITPQQLAPSAEPGQHFATSPRGGGKAAGLELLFRGVNFILQWAGGRQAKNALQTQLNRLAPQVERDL